MKQYLDSLGYILEHGEYSDNRTNTGARQVTGLTNIYHMKDGFPACTTKKLAWKAVLSELLWFLSGSSDERKLAEILHGTRDPEKKTIWSQNAEADYWKDKAKFAGDLGRVYGVQWRSWNAARKYPDSDVYYVEEIDQLANVVADIKAVKQDPTLSVARRLIVTAWNPAELDEMCLPPCHLFFQFHVINGRLDCQFYMRSIDEFLGAPFNIASYAILLHMVAQCCDLVPGKLIHNQGNCHIYENHIDQVKEQLTREPYPLPKIWLNPERMHLRDFTMDDIKLIDYKHHDAIKAPMAV